MLAAINAVYAPVTSPTTGPDGRRSIQARVPLSEWDEDDLSALAKKSAIVPNGTASMKEKCGDCLRVNTGIERFIQDVTRCRRRLLQYDVEHGLRIVTWRKTENGCPQALAGARRSETKNSVGGKFSDTYHEEATEGEKAQAQ